MTLPKIYLYRRIVQAKLYIWIVTTMRLLTCTPLPIRLIFRYHFIRLFSKIYGKTPYQYLTGVRMDKAQLLLQTDMPVQRCCRHGAGCALVNRYPPEQPDLGISLMAISEGMMFKKEAAAAIRDLVGKGTFGFGVFECNNLVATYEELKAKGVEFTKEPTKEFYGYEALFKDDSGMLR